MLLFLCMFTKVATYHRDMQDIALVAVSLYFVFDLDEQVFKSDPKLRRAYRRAVIQQTVPNPHDRPMLMMRMAAMAIGLVRFMMPIGLCCIVLLAWRRQDGFKIGGDGIAETSATSAG